MQTCALSHPREAEGVGNTQELTCGDKALVLCEFSTVLSNFIVLPLQNSIRPDMSAIEYASRISMSGLRVLSAYFAKLKQPLRVEDLSVMSMTRYEDVAVNKAF